MAERNYWVMCDNNCRFPAMTKEQILAAIAEATGATVADVDQAFITKIKEMNANASLKFWVGTTAEYNALTERENDVLYILSDDDTGESIDALVLQIEALGKRIDEMSAIDHVAKADYAESAGQAQTAQSATNAAWAANAENAANAQNAVNAVNADYATNAGYAERAGVAEATNAENAERATFAETAGSAGNASNLVGSINGRAIRDIFFTAPSESSVGIINFAYVASVLQDSTGENWTPEMLKELQIRVQSYYDVLNARLIELENKMKEE